MALEKTNIDKTLEIVKDLDKFKKRIKELAKAEASANDAMAKSKAKNVELFAEYDAKIKEGTARVKSLSDQAKQLEKDIQPGRDALADERAALSKLDALILKRQVRLAQGKAELAEAKAELKDEEKVLHQKAGEFLNAASAALKQVTQV